MRRGCGQCYSFGASELVLEGGLCCCDTVRMGGVGVAVDVGLGAGADVDVDADTAVGARVCELDTPWVWGLGLGAGNTSGIAAWNCAPTRVLAVADGAAR